MTDEEIYQQAEVGTRMRDFATWYGGRASSFKPPLVVEKLKAVRYDVGSLAAKQSKDNFGPKFPVKSAKELLSKLAQALHDNDCAIVVVNTQVTHFQGHARGKDKHGREVEGTKVHVITTIRFCAPDGSYIDSVGSGHGADTEDKAGGKASTYAWKDAVIKLLTLPDKDIVDTDDTGGDEAPEGASDVGSMTGRMESKPPAVQSQPASGEAPKRRGRPPGSKNKTTEEKAQAGSTPAQSLPTVDEINAMFAEAEQTKPGIARVYEIRDTYVKPQNNEALNKAVTNAYLAARNAQPDRPVK